MTERNAHDTRGDQPIPVRAAGEHRDPVTDEMTAPTSISLDASGAVLSPVSAFPTPDGGLTAVQVAERVSAGQTNAADS